MRVWAHLIPLCNYHPSAIERDIFNAADECIHPIQLRTPPCVNFIGNLALITYIIVSPEWRNHIGELA